MHIKVVYVYVVSVFTCVWTHVCEHIQCMLWVWKPQVNTMCPQSVSTSYIEVESLTEPGASAVTDLCLPGTKMTDGPPQMPGFYGSRDLNPNPVKALPIEPYFLPQRWLFWNGLRELPDSKTSRHISWHRTKLLHRRTYMHPCVSSASLYPIRPLFLTIITQASEETEHNCFSFYKEGSHVGNAFTTSDLHVIRAKHQDKRDFLGASASPIQYEGKSIVT